MKRIILFLIVFLSTVGYFGFANTFKRSDHIEIFVAFVLLFISYILMVTIGTKTKTQFYILFSAGLLFRLMFLFTTPHLSDDYFRFTWDGELSKDGISAFSFQPRNYQDKLSHRADLLPKYEALLNAKTDEFPKGMNSKQYYSIYPTVNQAVFCFSSWIGSSNNGNLVVIRLLLILAEVISFFVLRRLLLSSKRSRIGAHLYWLNPLVIIELSGNLHFDGFAITFMLLALLFFTKERWLPSVLSLSLAVATKLNPIFFFAAVFEKLKWRKFVLYGLSLSVMIFLLFVLILDETTFFNFVKSFGLYFAWFEFNTGIYSFLKIVAVSLTGVDVSSKLSIAFPIITILLFLKITFFSPKTKIEEKILLLYFVYFLFSPIVHPWYVTVLIPFGVLTGRIYPILWSFLIFFTYSAYSEDGFNQPYTIVFLEYALLYIFFNLEMKTNRLEGLKRRLFMI